MPWSDKFSAPIPLPDRDQLDTLDDARTFLNGLKNYECNAPEWQSATDAVLLAGDSTQHVEAARAAMMRALYPEQRA